LSFALLHTTNDNQRIKKNGLILWKLSFIWIWLTLHATWIELSSYLIRFNSN
jgi:hypothetical protein